MEKMAYTIAEVSAMTGYSRQMVTRLFQDEPGILVLERAETMHKRRYRNIRIPAAVYNRVLGRLKR